MPAAAKITKLPISTTAGKKTPLLVLVGASFGSAVSSIPRVSPAVSWGVSNYNILKAIQKANMHLMLHLSSAFASILHATVNVRMWRPWFLIPTLQAQQHQLNKHYLFQRCQAKLVHHYEIRQVCTLQACAGQELRGTCAPNTVTMIPESMSKLTLNMCYYVQVSRWKHADAVHSVTSYMHMWQPRQWLVTAVRPGSNWSLAKWCHQALQPRGGLDTSRGGHDRGLCDTGACNKGSCDRCL